MAKAKSKPTGKPASKSRSARKSAARKKTSARRAPVVAAKRRPRQAFVASHHRDEDFKTDGLRAYAKYRDLGIAKATGGLAVAHVIRFVPPCRSEEVSKLHLHDVDFQMIYVLKGTMTTELEGQGAITMKAGSCWIQPPRIKHKVLHYSDDCEVLEIVLPADFETVELQ